MLCITIWNPSIYKGLTISVSNWHVGGRVCDLFLSRGLRVRENQTFFIGRQWRRLRPTCIFMSTPSCLGTLQIEKEKQEGGKLVWLFCNYETRQHTHTQGLAFRLGALIKTSHLRPNSSCSLEPQGSESLIYPDNLLLPTCQIISHH